MAFKREPIKKTIENNVTEGRVKERHGDCQPSDEPTKMDIAMQRQIVFILTSLNNLTNSVSRLKRQFIVISVVYALIFVGLLFVALLRRF